MPEDTVTVVIGATGNRVVTADMPGKDADRYRELTRKGSKKDDAERRQLLATSTNFGSYTYAFGLAPTVLPGDRLPTEGKEFGRFLAYDKKMQTEYLDGKFSKQDLMTAKR